MNKHSCYNRRQGIINKLGIWWGWALFWFRLLIGFFVQGNTLLLFVVFISSTFSALDLAHPPYIQHRALGWFPGLSKWPVSPYLALWDCQCFVCMTGVQKFCANVLGGVCFQLNSKQVVLLILSTLVQWHCSGWGAVCLWPHRHPVGLSLLPLLPCCPMWGHGLRCLWPLPAGHVILYM